MVEDLSTFFTRTGTPVLFFALRRIQQNAEAETGPRAP